MDTTAFNDRRDRVYLRRGARHRATDDVDNFSASFRALGSLAYDGARVSASVRDIATGRQLLAIDDGMVLPTASVGKVLLLIEAAARLTSGDVTGYGILDKGGARVADSGVWQHLQVPSLPVADLATLIGATSDNLATNVLLREIGLQSVRSRAESIGLVRTALLDLVRDARGADDAPQLSVGSTAELAWLFAALARNEIVDAGTSQRVIAWLSLNMDTSLVASAFGLDPLSHRSPDHLILLVNKTGADAGVRSEAGVLSGPRGSISYAVSVHFAEVNIAARLRVIEALRTVGMDLLENVHTNRTAAWA